MKKSRFIQTQIVSISQAGRCRGVREGHLPAGRYQRADVLPVEVEVQRHGGVRSEAGQRAGSRDAKLKRMYAALALDNAAMKDLIAEKL